MPNYGEVLHIAAVLFEDLPNEVFIYNIKEKTQFSQPIMFEKGW